MEIDDILDNLLNSIIATSVSEKTLPSMGVVPQTTWFTSSISFMLLECIRLKDEFDEDYIENVIKLYIKQSIK